MLNILLITGILDVEVAAVGQDVAGVDAPGAVVLFAVGPPGEAVFELFVLHGLGFGVVLAPVGQGLFVVPHPFCRAGAVEEKQVGGDAGVGGEDAVGQAHDSVQVELFQQFLFDAGAHAVAEEGAIGHDDGGASGRGRAFELAHDELQEEQGGFGALLIRREVVEDAALLFSAKRRIGENDVDALAISYLADGHVEAVAQRDLRRFQPVQQQVHLGQQIGQRFGLAAVDARFLQRLTVLYGAALLLEMQIGLDEEAAGAAGGVEHCFAQARIDGLHHEAHDRARRVELARVPGGVAHLFEHRFVEVSQCVYLFGRGEVDGVDLVDDVAQQVAVDHAIDDAAKDGGDDVAPVNAAATLQGTQVGEESRAFLAVGPRSLFVVDEGDQVAARQYGCVAVGPVAPAIGRFDGRAKTLAAYFGLRLVQLLHIIQEFEEQYPGQHGQAVQVAIQPLILAHYVAHGFDDAAELLGGGDGGK